MMNVLYAGINNPISISVPGVPMTAVQATMTNGTLTRNGDQWIAHPGKVGTEAVISVSAQLDGRTQQVGSMTFRVRKLPDPTPYIAMKDGNGNTVHYKGSPKRISKGALMAAEGLGAAIDDDLLNVSFTVVSFSTIFFDSMGNAIPEVSAGSRFSDRQKEQFRRLKPGKSFFISNVKAKGPDGITRDISPMEVALN
jgi:gliding motility-associated protein GldM